MASQLDHIAHFGVDPRAINEDIIKAAGYSAEKLREQGYNEHQLKYVGFDAFELKAAGFDATQLRCASFTPEELRKAGFTCAQLFEAGFSHRRLMLCGYTAIEMKEDLELNLPQLVAAGFQASHLKAVGYHCAELKHAGYHAKELRHFYSPGEIFRAGFTKEELKPLGLWPHDGSWHSYNQYWDCCFSLDKKSKYCVGLDTGAD